MKAKVILAAALIPTGLPAGEANRPAVLGHLETQGRVVTIFAGEKPTYTVKTKDGTILAERVASDQLQQKDPALAKFLREALAPNHAIADASLRR
jgi:hypothetical protein